VLRLLLVDDHAIVRAGLRAVLAGEPAIDVVGEAGTAAEAIVLAEQLQPDIVLMDVRLPDQSGITATREICSRRPQTQVLMLTSFADETLVLESIDAGAAGYVLKQIDPEELIRALHSVGHGDAVLSPEVTRKLLGRVRRAEHESRHSALRDFSERELDVLALIAEGKTNEEIATALTLSEKTVANHVSNILAKIGVANRIGAATFAVRNHIERFAPRSG
jgi:two-component system, NarL family, response regulator DevR